MDWNKLITLLPKFTFEQILILLFGAGIGFLIWKLGTRIALAIEQYLMHMQVDLVANAKSQETILQIVSNNFKLLKKICKKMNIDNDE